MRPNSASKIFWAEAEATEVRSVVAVTPVTRMSLTPRLKRVCRRINKAKGPPTRAPTIPSAPSFNTFGDGRKYDLGVPGVRRLEPIASKTIAPTKHASWDSPGTSGREAPGDLLLRGQVVSLRPRPYRRSTRP